MQSPSSSTSEERPLAQAQASLEEDEHVLDAARLACIDGAGVQTLLRRPTPLPLQEERARLLREVEDGEGWEQGVPNHEPVTALS